MNKTKDSLANIRQEDGTLPLVAWPGCYPLVYIANDGGTVCPACANGENGAEFTTDPNADADGWRLDGAQIHWEGEPEHCAHCNKEIESAYGPC